MVTGLLALKDIDDQAIPLTLLEKQAKILFVCLGILARQQNIINVHKGKIQIMTNFVY